MKEKIEAKIADIVDYIAGKPVAEVTLDDYTVLKTELAEIRSVESREDSGKRMAQLMANAFSSAGCLGYASIETEPKQIA